MTLVDDILLTLPYSKVHAVHIGTHWTAVVLETENGKKCGLASTLGEAHEHRRGPDVQEADRLDTYSAHELTQLIYSDRTIETIVGLRPSTLFCPIINGKGGIETPPICSRRWEKIKK